MLHMDDVVYVGLLFNLSKRFTYWHPWPPKKNQFIISQKTLSFSWGVDYLPREKGPMPLPGRRSRTITPIAVPSQRRRGRCSCCWWWCCNMLFASLRGCSVWFGFCFGRWLQKSVNFARGSIVCSLNAFIPSICPHASFCFLSDSCHSMYEMTSLWCSYKKRPGSTRPRIW
jgi:hypothetical protein